MRLRGKKGVRELLEQQPQLVVLEPEQHKGKWQQYFGNDRPIYVELGMGKGQFVSQMSLNYPDVNFIGIDMYDELIHRATEKVQEKREGQVGRSNIALVRANVEFLEKVFADGEIERIFLNFSDPWPKKRHARRRLSHSHFLDKYQQVLNDKGELHMKTDSETLFESSLNSFAEYGLQMRNISLNLHRDGVNEEHVMTEYEQKFHSRGMNIHRVEVLFGAETIRQYRAAKQS
ncbi:tRNA (guanosine(46)-N7)-methyltransferase TrmB [Paenibacillus sp. 481]|uniref:tRNA (guanosine(46)-N7)-methyltransferase TrmB n=1 Tax=Paenibacillus sp. 481 TaxID=2835869 RepID=UPI001E366525|nr:tRNA (guanosine(46)-N7)-methyltransferase TrmB [Paenibacillus sp. 481]UHA72242.1 tRNA (guanosine(46)-N7)-methyltransferase TrmB [Paenibacillus sp. 481]